MRTLRSVDLRPDRRRAHHPDLALGLSAWARGRRVLPRGARDRVLPRCARRAVAGRR